MFCGVCKNYVSSAQENLPEIKDLLRVHCISQKSSEEILECLDAVDKLVDFIKDKKPEDTCIQLGFCRARQSSSLGDFLVLL